MIPFSEVHFWTSMMASGGPSYLCSVSNSLRKSSRFPSGLRDTRSVRVDGSCGRQGLLCGASGQAWWSFLVLPVTLLTLIVSAHSQTSENREALNTQIYMQAFASLQNIKIKTGTVYNATLPSNLTDQSVESLSVARVRTGTLKRNGFNLGEIIMPKGMKVLEPLVRVVLVYRRFKEYPFYNATSGDVFVAPVVGILVYDADDITNYTNYIRPALTVVASISPIQVQFGNSAPNNANCVLYNNTDYSATAAVNNLTGPSCSWNVVGDYSLTGPPKTKKKSHNAWKIAVGSVAGAILLLLLLALVACLAVKFKEKKKFAKMESKSDEGETLHHTSIGGSRAPAAASTRTKPFLENEYVS